MKQKILAVDDEPDALELIEFHLSAAGYEVIGASDGAEALANARKFLPDAILLDLMLPELSGLEVCKILRQDDATRQIPILMLTAKAAEIDRVLGLELGADDYITKPFSPRELVLRVKALLRRVQATPSTPSRFAIGDLALDTERHSVTYKDKSITLTPTEFKLLRMLMQRRGCVQSREQLLTDVWEYESILGTRTVDVHMRRIREKLGAGAKHIETIRGVGYRITDES